MRKPCCPSPVEGHVDYDGDPDPCCLTDPCPDAAVPPFTEPKPDAGKPDDPDAQASLCDGQCVPAPPDGWWMAALLWTGSPDMEPSCPASAPIEGYRGYADLVAPPHSCGLCGCDNPEGKCGLPSHLTASTNTCASPGGTVSSFDGPEDWDGSCTAKNAIPGGATCNGSPCVKSLSVEPLTLTESCTPHVIVPKGGPAPDPAWKTSALACQLNEYPACEGKEKLCVPAAEEGFSTCIFTWDDRPCPPSYPMKKVVYDGYADTRACSDCKCSPPVGSQCTGLLSVSETSACAGPIVVDPIFVSDQPFCFDLPPGVALGSKQIMQLAYAPGACQPSGGEETGAVAPIGAATFCCLQA